MAATVFFFLVRPLRWRVTDEQVALYLEEHEPSLQATLISAIEASRRGETPLSPALVQRLVEQAIEACCTNNMARRIEEVPLRLLAGRWGAGYEALRKRRQRAEAALVGWLRDQGVVPNRGGEGGLEG